MVLEPEMGYLFEILARALELKRRLRLTRPNALASSATVSSPESDFGVVSPIFEEAQFRCLNSRLLIENLVVKTVIQDAKLIKG
jgi:hypothetical protein